MSTKMNILLHCDKLIEVILNKLSLEEVRY